MYICYRPTYNKAEQYLRIMHVFISTSHVAGNDSVCIYLCIWLHVAFVCLNVSESTPIQSITRSACTQLTATPIDEARNEEAWATLGKQMGHPRTACACVFFVSSTKLHYEQLHCRNNMLCEHKIAQACMLIFARIS